MSNCEVCDATHERQHQNNSVTEKKKKAWFGENLEVSAGIGRSPPQAKIKGATQQGPINDHSTPSHSKKSKHSSETILYCFQHLLNQPGSTKP